MNQASASVDSRSSILCKSCGLCCTGHLFVWTKLRSPELDAIQALGVTVFRDPDRRGFSQPCPLWKGQCTIYASPRYPRFCHTYKCKLLKQTIDGVVPLSKALTVVRQAQVKIAELEPLLPASPVAGFRERLVMHIEDLNKLDVRESEDERFLQEARELLDLYELRFGIHDLVGWV